MSFFLNDKIFKTVEQVYFDFVNVTDIQSYCRSCSNVFVCNLSSRLQSSVSEKSQAKNSLTSTTAMQMSDPII